MIRRCLIVKYEYVTKEYIRSNEFIADEAPIQKTEPSYRLNQSDPLPPSCEELQAELRKHFSSIYSFVLLFELAPHQQ